MSSDSSSPISQLAELPITLSYEIPTPTNNPLNENSILISTRYDENKTESGIYSLNLVTNESQMIYEYPKSDWQQYKVYWHGQFINPSDKKLILYGGQYNTYSIVDLETKKMEEYPAKNVLSEVGNNPKYAVMPTPINEIHVMDINCNHFIFDMINKQTTKIDSELQFECDDEDNDIDDDILYPKLICLSKHKKLFVFGANNTKKIFEFEHGKWKVNKTLQMPYIQSECHYDIINAFGIFLLVIYYKKQKMFLFDVYNMKWYGSKYNISYNFEGSGYYCHAVKLHTDAHIIDFYSNVHFKINLFGLIPHDTDLLPRIYNRLIVGYVREIQDENDAADMKILNLILKYFGSF